MYPILHLHKMQFALLNHSPNLSFFRSDAKFCLCCSSVIVFSYLVVNIIYFVRDM